MGMERGVDLKWQGRLREIMAREELVQSACGFLRAYDAGERLDAMLEKVELAKVINEYGRLCTGVVPRLGSERLRFIREASDLRSRRMNREPDEERERVVWDRPREIKGEAEEAIDAAAEKLSQIAAERFVGGL